MKPIGSRADCPPLFDWCWLNEQLDDLIRSNPQSIVLKRDTKNGEIALPPQIIRLARGGNARGRIERDSSFDMTKDVHIPVVIVGDENLNIQPDDRFFHAGSLYRVTAVRPHGLQGTTGCPVNIRAEAEKIN